MPDDLSDAEDEVMRRIHEQKTPTPSEEAKAEVVQFPKKCPYCGHVMEHIVRFSMEYLECPNFEGCTYPGRDTYTYARRYR